MSALEAFFRDLRALRAGAGLSLAELAERAYFPEETLAATEAGPAVPPNPVLVAYVQACGGPVGQWEDRWRDVSAAASSGFLTGAFEPAGGARPAPPRRHRGHRRHRGRRAAVAAVAVALITAGAAVALTRPAARTTASAVPRSSPSTSTARHATSRPRPLRRPPASPAPPIMSVMQVTGVGCPASQHNGVTLTAASPGPPRTGAQGNGLRRRAGVDHEPAREAARPAGAKPAPPGHSPALAASAAAVACSGPQG
jgi:transcriptional regulator with XRE-family HTH domain